MSEATKFMGPHEEVGSCVLCGHDGLGRAAYHEIAEVLTVRDRHPLTNYVCCLHFGLLMGAVSACTWRGCPG